MPSEALTIKIHEAQLRVYIKVRLSSVNPNFEIKLAAL